MSLRFVAALLGAGAGLANAASFANFAADTGAADANTLSEVVVTSSAVPISQCRSTGWPTPT